MTPAAFCGLMLLDGLTSGEGVTVGAGDEAGVGVDGSGEDVLSEENISVEVVGWTVSGRQPAKTTRAKNPMVSGHMTWAQGHDILYNRFSPSDNSHVIVNSILRSINAGYKSSSLIICHSLSILVTHSMWRWE
jgi:hypothetical protein